jgi:hypothetical protein
VIGASGLGIAAGLSLRKRKFSLAALIFVPFVYFIWHTQSNEAQRENEKELALDYITHNAQMNALLGSPVKTSISSPTEYNDRSRGRYEFHIQGSTPLYALVDVHRSSGKPEFRLACVTTLSIGQRQAGKDDCQQATVALP